MSTMIIQLRDLWLAPRAKQWALRFVDEGTFVELTPGQNNSADLWVDSNCLALVNGEWRLLGNIRTSKKI